MLKFRKLHYNSDIPLKITSAVISPWRLEQGLWSHWMDSLKPIIHSPLKDVTWGSVTYAKCHYPQKLVTLFEELCPKLQKQQPYFLSENPSTKIFHLKAHAQIWLTGYSLLEKIKFHFSPTVLATQKAYCRETENGAVYLLTVPTS